jgi:AcrR family transcriptional regulator
LTKVALSPDGIFRAALRLVDAAGLDALTMRRLATELGVATMSLYSHVPTKDDLVVGMVDLATREIRLPEATAEPWEAWKTITREFRRVSLLHPNLVGLIVLRPPRGAQGLRTLEAALDALRRAGIPASRAASAYRLAASFAIGFVTLESRFFRPVEPTAAADVTPIDPSELPRIGEVARYLVDWDADVEFEAGLDAMMGVMRGLVDGD